MGTPITRLQLSPGDLPVYFVENRTVPLVTLRVVIRSGYGAALDKTAVASLVTRFMLESVTQRALRDRTPDLAELGASLAGGVTADSSQITLTTMKDSFHRSLSSLSDAVVRPRFEESTLIRLRDRTMNDIRTRRDTGATLAEDVLRRILYGARHPYSNSELGDEASLPAIALPDIVSYYKKHWRISNATIVVTGDIDISVLRESLTRLVHEWSKEPRSPKSDVEALPLPEQPLPAHLARKIVLINKAGAVQSSIAIGDTGVKRTSDDWLPLEVLNRIVGGGPGSRLYTSLRETYGYTYGVSSQFTEARDGGYFIIRTAVAVENTALAVREILSQLEAIVARPPSDIEVERAKRSAVFGLPLRLESSNQLLDALGNIAVFRLPSDYFNLYGLNMLGITPSQVAHAAKKHLHPESLQIVIVGPTPKIEHDLRMLNVAPVEKRTETGELAVDRL